MNNNKGPHLFEFKEAHEARRYRAELNQLFEVLEISEDQMKEWRRLVRLMRRLSPGGKELSFQETCGLAQRNAEIYERFLVSKVPIRALEVRVGEMKFWNTLLNHPDGIRETTFERALPEDAVLQVWRPADAEFGEEVPLLFQDLDGISSEGLSSTKHYNNGRSITLQVEKKQNGEFKIKLSFPVGDGVDADLFDSVWTEDSPTFAGMAQTVEEPAHYDPRLFRGVYAHLANSIHKTIPGMMALLAVCIIYALTGSRSVRNLQMSEAAKPANVAIPPHISPPSGVLPDIAGVTPKNSPRSNQKTRIVQQVKYLKTSELVTSKGKREETSSRRAQIIATSSTNSVMAGGNRIGFYVLPPELLQLSQYDYSKQPGERSYAHKVSQSGSLISMVELLGQLDTASIVKSGAHDVYLSTQLLDTWAQETDGTLAKVSQIYVELKSTELSETDNFHVRENFARPFEEPGIEVLTSETDKFRTKLVVRLLFGRKELESGSVCAEMYDRHGKLVDTIATEYIRGDDETLQHALSRAARSLAEQMISLIRDARKKAVLPDPGSERTRKVAPGLSAD